MQRGGQFDESTLLIWGDLDRAVGLSSGRQLASMLPQSSLLVIPAQATSPSRRCRMSATSRWATGWPRPLPEATLS